jgi:hypothetical protein
VVAPLAEDVEAAAVLLGVVLHVSVEQPVSARAAGGSRNPALVFAIAKLALP